MKEQPSTEGTPEAEQKIAEIMASDLKTKVCTVAQINQNQQLGITRPP